MSRSLVPVLGIASWILAVCGCGRPALLVPETAAVHAPALASAASRSPQPSRRAARHEEGRLGPGATYAFDVPERWNGTLVLYVHGYTPPFAPVAIPDLPMRGFLLDQGFAVAMSSFSENGYAVAEGARQSHQLLGVFTARFGRPNATLVLGVSLGGLIGLELTERFPQQIDGALLVSGVTGGSRAEIGYIGDLRVLWDYFYPGTIPGSLFQVPVEMAFDPQWVIRAISTPAGRERLPLLLAFATARGLPLGPEDEPVVGLIHALGFHWMGAMDLFDRTHGHMLFDNHDVRYEAPGVPPEVVDAVNAGVARHAAAPDAEAFLTRCYEPRGTIAVPVMTLHGERDPVVPLFHEGLMAARVAERGRAHLLVQRSVPRFGHVAYEPEEVPAAFLALVQWVRQGSRPIP